MKEKKIIGILAIAIIVIGGAGYYTYHQNIEKVSKNQVLLVKDDLNSGNIEKAEKDIQKLNTNSINYKILEKQIGEEKTFIEKSEIIKNSIKDEEFKNAEIDLKTLEKESNQNNYEKQQISNLKTSLNTSLNDKNHEFVTKVQDIQNNIESKNIIAAENGLKELKEMNITGISSAKSTINNLELSCNKLENEINNKITPNNIVEYFNKCYASNNIQLIRISNSQYEALGSLQGGNITENLVKTLNNLANEYPNKILYTLNQGPCQITINNKKAYVMVIESIQGYGSVVGNTPFIIIGANGHIYSTKEVGEAVKNGELTWNNSIQPGPMGGFLNAVKQTDIGENLQKGVEYFEKYNTTMMGQETYFTLPNNKQQALTINDIADNESKVLTNTTQVQSTGVQNQNNLSDEN
ncbi:hypothetical protein [Clostridium sp.]|uniref:hypothetical protein n=1 Tax=Clostridium sp. TaxID=1506 RepID=UPI003991B5DB